METLAGLQLPLQALPGTSLCSALGSSSTLLCLLAACVEVTGETKRGLSALTAAVSFAVEGEFPHPNTPGCGADTDD